MEMPSFLKKKEAPVSTTEGAIVEKGVNKAEVGPELKAETAKTASLVKDIFEKIKNLKPDTVIAGGLTAAAFIYAFVNMRNGSADNTIMDPSEIAGVLAGAGTVFTGLSHAFHKEAKRIENEEMEKAQKMEGITA